MAEEANGAPSSADRLGQAILAERGFEERPHPLVIGLLHRLAAQQIAAAGIGDSQRIDACSVARAEPALEVGAPDPGGFSVGRSK
jgi:hypothetical protein